MRLKERLRGIIPKEDLAGLVASFDVVGDIAIIIVPDTLREYEQEIGAAVLESNRKLRLVAKRAGLYGGEYRTIPLQVLAGEGGTETEIKEFGVRLQLDPGKVYFSVRSGNERKRIASQVAAGEKVMVFFSGVAPYPLLISRLGQAASIVGIEKNPAAHVYALRNLRLNRKLRNITLFQGDVRRVGPLLDTAFDRVVMPLPTGSENFLPTALDILKPGGVLHFYDLQHQDSFPQSVEKIGAACRTKNRRLLGAEIIRAGHCGPRTYRICVDARVG